MLVVNLPDETLADILGRLVDCEKKVYDKADSDVRGLSSTRRALVLSSVCRRFRSVLLGTAGAWAVITTDERGIEFLKMCAKRSADIGLRVYASKFFSESEGSAKLFSNLYRIQNISPARIFSLFFCINDSNSRGWTRFLGLSGEEEAVQLLHKLDYSKLKAVGIHYKKNFSVQDENNDDGDGQDDDDGVSESESEDNENEDSEEIMLADKRKAYEMGCLLRAPNLQSASFTNTIPRVGLMHSLTKLSLGFYYASIFKATRESHGWDAQKLVDLLLSQSSLEYLFLEIYEELTFKFGTSDVVAALPSIKHLDLRWHGLSKYHATSRYPLWDIPTLFSLLSMKNVEAFRFSLSAAFEHDDFGMPLPIHEHLRFFLRDGVTFPHLKTFHLEFYSRNIEELCLPASYIQNIRNLSLKFNTKLSLAEIRDISDVALGNCHTPVTGNLPHLEILTLRNCDNITVNTVRAFVDAMTAGGNTENFRKLVVDECRYLPKYDLKAMVDPRKLEFHEDSRIFACF